MGRTVEPALMGQRIEWQDEGGGGGPPRTRPLARDVFFRRSQDCSSASPPHEEGLS